MCHPFQFIVSDSYQHSASFDIDIAIDIERIIKLRITTAYSPKYKR